MTAENALWKLEERFWTSGPDFYLRHLAEDSLMLVPGAPAGLTKAETVESVGRSPRWTAVTLSDRRVLRLGEGATVLCYTALARREGEDREYRALVSSGYARRAGPWELVFHQQTPAA